MYLLCLEKLRSNLEKQKIQNHFEVLRTDTYLILQAKIVLSI